MSGSSIILSPSKDSKVKEFRYVRKLIPANPIANISKIESQMITKNAIKNCII